MNHILFDDYYCEESVNLIAEIEPLYLDNPQDILSRKPEAIKALFQGLLLTGVAMTMAETSAPASGGEHMISHTLDMMSTLDGVPHDLHGRQVGLGTIICSEVYRRVMELESPDFVEPCLTVDLGFWGKLDKEIEREYSGKIERLKLARKKLLAGNNWDNFRAELKPLLRTPDKIQSCLKNADAAWRAEHIKCDRNRLLTVFKHSHEIRSRFTILDLARLVGVLPGAEEEIIDNWA
jgi:glycerol-1-phosphate dehydrogenase [NAD(P)+]